MAAVEQDITAEQGAALAVTLTGAGASLQGRTLRMHVRSKVGVTTTKLVASTSDSRLTVGADPYTTAALAIGSDVMAAVSVTLPVEYWVYDVESYTTAADVRREWSGRFTITRDVTRDTEADTEDSLAGLVRYDTPQSLTDAQMIQARANIDFAESVRDLVGTTLVAGSNVTITVSDAGDTITIASSGGGGGSAAWGSITGTLSAQTDLQSALDLKAPLASPTLTGTPAAPTAAGGTSTTQIATTAFAAGEITTHAGATDPHGDRSFATSAVSTHNAVTTAHGISAFGATLVDDADAATARTTLGLGTAATSASGDFATAGHTHSGVYQPADAELTAIAGLTSAADSAPYFTGSGTAALMTVTAAGRALIDDADATAQRATLGLVIGTNVQAYDADLTTWAGITPGTGVGTALGTNVGTAGSVVVNGGALGTPSSGALTNCTFPTLNQNTSGYAEALKSATTTVNVSAATAPSSGQVLTATSSTAATWQTPSGGSSNTKWVGAGELIPRVTSGAGIDGEELATNKINLDYLAFDSASAEYAQVSFAWPSGFTTFTAQFHWTAASGSGTVTWTAAARCYADDDALDQAQGTAQSVTDTLLAANDAHKSSATSAVTPGGTVSAGNLCVAQFGRDVADTLAVDARLIGVLLSFA